jgi:hypothetical protein
MASQQRMTIQAFDNWMIIKPRSNNIGEKKSNHHQSKLKTKLFVHKIPLVPSFSKLLWQALGPWKTVPLFTGRLVPELIKKKTKKTKKVFFFVWEPIERRLQSRASSVYKNGRLVKVNLKRRTKLVESFLT